VDRLGEQQGGGSVEHTTSDRSCRGSRDTRKCLDACLFGARELGRDLE